MARETFTLDTRDAVRTLVRLGRGSELREAGRKRLREAGKPLKQAAKRLAPEDEGTLSRVITLRASRRSRRSIGVIVGPPPSKGLLGLPAGATGYYPTHVELGSRSRGIEPDRYLYGAMDETIENSKRVLGELGGDIVRIALRP